MKNLIQPATKNGRWLDVPGRSRMSKAELVKAIAARR